MLIYVVSDLAVLNANQSYQLAAFSNRQDAVTYRDKHAELWDGDPEDYNIVSHNLDEYSAGV